MSTTPVSFEFFPPNTPVGVEKLKTVVQELGALKPQYFSVTYGAGGSTRDKTLAAVSDIAASDAPAVLVSAHIGNWEVMPAVLAETAPPRPPGPVRRSATRPRLRCAWRTGWAPSRANAASTASRCSSSRSSDPSSSSSSDSSSSRRS